MRFCNQAHAFYCGVDLHARSMFTHVLDQGGATVFARNLAANPQVFLEAVAPFRQGLVVGCECLFDWYWSRRGDRARRLAWPARGTERFLGRDGPILLGERGSGPEPSWRGNTQWPDPV